MSEKVNGGHIVLPSEGDRKAAATPLEWSDEPVTLHASRFDYAISESDKISSIDLDPEKVQVISEHVLVHHVSGAPAIWVQLAKYSGLETCEDEYRLLIAPTVKFEHELPFIFKKVADNGMELIAGMTEDIPLVLGWVMREFTEFPFLDDVGEGEVKNED